MDNELVLFDRLNVIRDTINKYGEENFYLSFSGGKDSTILHYLLDIAFPNNQIPRVFIDTGIEYNLIREFVLQMGENDYRFHIIKPSKPIKETLETYGYPFKSKEHSMRVQQFNKGSTAKYIQKYITGMYEGRKITKYVCSKKLLYQFEEKGKYNYSNLCCYKLKKEPVHKWEKHFHRHMVITGMRSEEGGNRERIKGCILTDKKGKLIKFHPLLVVSEAWEDWFIKEYNIQLCKLYYEPYNFKRTGCKGCPFALKLQEQLDIMEKYLPNERKQCEFIWKPIYDEYRRIGYRLRKEVKDE